MLSDPHFHVTTPKTSVTEQPQLTLLPHSSMKPKAPNAGYVDRTWSLRNPNQRSPMNWAWHASNSPSSTPQVSAFAKARAEAQLQTTALRGRAVRIVAHQSADADDCRRLLSMLGLDDELAEPAPAAARYPGEYGRRID
jgi:hypothetical protein